MEQEFDVNFVFEVPVGQHEFPFAVVIEAVFVPDLHPSPQANVRAPAKITATANTAATTSPILFVMLKSSCMVALWDSCLRSTA